MNRFRFSPSPFMAFQGGPSTLEKTLSQAPEAVRQRGCEPRVPGKPEPVRRQGLVRCRVSRTIGEAPRGTRRDGGHSRRNTHQPARRSRVCSTHPGRSRRILGCSTGLRDRADAGVRRDPVLSLRFLERQLGVARIRGERISADGISGAREGRTATVEPTGDGPVDHDGCRLPRHERPPLRLVRHCVGPSPDPLSVDLLLGAGGAVLLWRPGHRRNADGV